MILFYASLYSSLVKTVIDEKWKPMGMPAYYKLIEELSKRKIPLLIIYHCREKMEKFRNIREIKLSEINAKIYVLPWISMKILPLRIERRLNKFIHSLSLICFVIKYNPGLIYTDKSHTIEAAFLTLFGKKVFLRIYGVTKTLFEDLERSKNERMRGVLYKSFLAKYAYVVGSLDGSDIETFFLKFLNKKVPRKLLLNGVDKCINGVSEKVDIRKKYKIADGKQILLFVSRFTPEKGGLEFIEVIDELKQIVDNFIALMIGYGPLEEKYQNTILRKGLSDYVKIMGPMDHGTILNVLTQTDLLMSFNKEGNLCNTVLEAISNGMPVVTYKDRHTFEFYKSAVIYVEKMDRPSKVSQIAYNVLTNESVLKQYRNRAKEFSKKNLKSWKDRIEEEINILYNILEIKTL